MSENLGITYPDKTSNQNDPDEISKFRSSDANEIKNVVNQHKEKLNEIEDQLITSSNPFYGRFTSLAVLITAYPTGVLNAWAIIDAGVGVTPQIAAWDDVSNEWETSGASTNIVYVANTTELPQPGIVNIFYITTDLYEVRVWHNNQYYIVGPSTLQSIHTFRVYNKETNPIESVTTGGVSFVYSGSEVIEVIFNATYSKYLVELMNNQEYDGFKIKLFNKNQQKQLTATIKELVYTNGTNTYIKAIVVDSIEHASLEIGDTVECFIDISNKRYAVKQLDTTIDEDIVNLGEIHLQRDATNIIKVVFDANKSKYVEGYKEALLNGKGLHLHVINKSKAYIGTAKVTQITYVDAGDTLYGVSVEAGILQSKILLGHELEFRFDVNDAPGAVATTLSKEAEQVNELIILPTAEGSSNRSVTHPCIRRIKHDLTPYKFVAAYTPYPAMTREDVWIAVSNDGVNWEEPTGINNPLDSYSDAVSLGHREFSDTDILELNDGTFVVMYRGTKDTALETWYIRTSSDLINWSNRQAVLTSPLGANIVSPSLVQLENGSIRAYYVNETGEAVLDNRIKYRESTDNCQTWGAEQQCTYERFYPDPAWHLQVIINEGVYHMLYNHRQAGIPSVTHDGMLVHQFSEDGINFKSGFGSIPRSGELHDVNGYYRCSFIPSVTNSEAFDLYLSGIGFFDSGAGEDVADAEWRISLRRNFKLVDNQAVSKAIDVNITLTDKHHEKQLKLTNNSNVIITVDLRLNECFQCAGIAEGTGEVQIVGASGVTITKVNSTDTINSQNGSFFLQRISYAEFLLYIINI